MARRSSQKRYRDPKAPRPTKKPWQLFWADHREEIKKDNPTLKRADIAKQLSELWRQCDDETKLRYQQRYNAGQVEYNEKLAAYKEEKHRKRQIKKANEIDSTSTDISPM